MGETTPDVDITPPKTREASLAADVEHDRKNKCKHVQETESESGHSIKVHKWKKHMKKSKHDEDESSNMDNSESSDEDDSESSDKDSDEAMASKKKHKHKWRQSKKSKKRCAYLHVVSLPHLNSMSEQNVVTTERRERVSVVFCFLFYLLPSHL